MTKLEAIKDLVKYNHAFLGSKGAEEIAKPFGIKPNLTREFDRRSEFKGLTLFGINPKTKKEFKEGDYAEGVRADILACAIADSLDIDYKVMFGIGSQLRETCKAIERYLKKEIKVTYKGNG